MSGDRIELRGIRVMGTHGLLDEERTRAQPFEIDLDVEMDLRPAGNSDRITDTVDYGAIAGIAASVVGGPHADLMEALAERIASQILAWRPDGPRSAAGEDRSVTAVRVTVRKLRPPVELDISTAAVAIRREAAPPRPGSPGDPAGGMR